MRIEYQIIGEVCGMVSGHFINDVDATLEDAADWIVHRTQRACGAESRIGWQVILFVDDKPAYGHRYQ